MLRWITITGRGEGGRVAVYRAFHSRSGTGLTKARETRCRGRLRGAN